MKNQLINVIEYLKGFQNSMDPTTFKTIINSYTRNFIRSQAHYDAQVDKIKKNIKNSNRRTPIISLP